MIPADLASRLKLVVPDQPAAPQPATPTKNLSDVLSDLVPGQRIMAEIQAMLPNGSYRAMVAQREITLALPFAAKPGDSLELEVVDNNGKVALAVVAKGSTSGLAGAAQDSVPTSISQTGKLIGDLIGGISDQGKRAAPAPLNGNQPLVEKFPANATDLVPVLKDALTKSGVFYEAHQARWVAGELPTEQLLQEPQGKHSSTQATPASTVVAGAPETAGNSHTPTTGNSVANNLALSDSKTASEASRLNPAVSSAGEQATVAAEKSPSTSMPADITPIVQQQLDALATQTFAWQGQIWPGQQMFWEIDDQGGNKQFSENNAGQWQTRLKLNLPQLGGIDATLSLRPGNEVAISLSADNGASEASLSAATTQLKQQFESAGLNLVQLLVKNGAAAE